MKKTKKGYAPIKIIWIMRDTITKIAYCQADKEADMLMEDYQNRRKGIAVKLYRSVSFGKYVTIPGD